MAAKELVPEVKKPNGSALAIATPLDLMSQAIAQGISAEQLQILQDMHFKSLDRQAEVEFNEALNRVQVQIPRIVPDLTNPQTSSKYASFATVDKAVRPIYTAEGFSLSFNTADCPKPDHVRIVAYLSRGKHTRNYQIDMPIVTTGIQGKAMMTLTHASAAANSYGKRYLECDIFNIPIGPDTDGVTPAEAKNDLDALDAAANEAELQKIFIGLYNSASGNVARQKVISQARDQKRASLRKAAQQHGTPVEFSK